MKDGCNEECCATWRRCFTPRDTILRVNTARLPVSMAFTETFFLVNSQWIQWEEH